MSRIGTETAFKVLAKAKEMEAKGIEVIHLEIGEPDFDTPKNIIDAAKRALDEGYTHYTPSPGLIEAREAIAEYTKKYKGLEYDPAKEIVVFPGAKPVMFFNILALVEPKDEVIIPNTGFPIYESMVNFIGAKPVSLPLKEELDFRFDPNILNELISDKTKLLILNSPHNPAGSVLSKSDFKAIAEIASDNNFYILSDEVYSRILYDGEKHYSIAQFEEMKERTIILDGFSKTYAMTGWRLGYSLAPEEITENFVLLQTNSTSCTCAFTQIAGIEALSGPQDAVDSMVKAFRERRDAIVDGLNRIQGISCRKPKGAFYVLANVKETGMSSKEFSDYLLYNAHVASLPGEDFGSEGEGYLRFSYANSVENIKKALENIESALQKLD